MHAEAFFSEYAHVWPFTTPSLHEALTLAGFEEVDVGYFRQLPFTWRHPWLLPPVAASGSRSPTVPCARLRGQAA
jgi:hypothetical protein